MMDTIVLEDDDDEEEDEDGYKRDNDSLRSESTADSILNGFSMLLVLCVRAPFAIE